MTLQIVFIVLMLFWLFGGGFVAYGDGPNFNMRHFGGYTLIPWICVAILGWVVFNGAVIVAQPAQQPALVR